VRAGPRRRASAAPAGTVWAAAAQAACAARRRPAATAQSRAGARTHPNLTSTQPRGAQVSTLIGYGSPNLADTHDVHGAALGAKETEATRKNLKWEFGEFEVPAPVYDLFGAAKQRGKEAQSSWNEAMESYGKQYPEVGSRPCTLLARAVARRAPARSRPACPGRRCGAPGTGSAPCWQPAPGLRPACVAAGSRCAGALQLWARCVGACVERYDLAHTQSGAGPTASAQQPPWACGPSPARSERPSVHCESSSFCACCVPAAKLFRKSEGTRRRAARAAGAQVVHRPHRRQAAGQLGEGAADAHARGQGQGHAAALAGQPQRALRGAGRCAGDCARPRCRAALAALAWTLGRALSALGLLRGAVAAAPGECLHRLCQGGSYCGSCLGPIGRASGLARTQTVRRSGRVTCKLRLL